MDSLFSFLIECLIYSSLSPEKPKIEVRLISYSPNKENEVYFEIENITNNLIELKTATIIYITKGSDKKFQQNLHLTEEQLSLPPFFPTRLEPIIFNEKECNIKYIEFKLMKHKLLKVKVLTNAFT